MGDSDVEMEEVEDNTVAVVEPEPMDVELQEAEGELNGLLLTNQYTIAVNILRHLRGMDLLRARLVSENWSQLGFLPNVVSHKYNITLFNDEFFDTNSELMQFLQRRTNMLSTLTLDSVDFLNQCNKYEIIKIMGKIGRHIKHLRIVSCFIDISKLMTLLAFCRVHLESLHVENFLPEEERCIVSPNLANISPFQKIITFSYTYDTHIAPGLVDFCNNHMPNLRNFALTHANEETYEQAFDAEKWAKIIRIIRDKRVQIKSLKFSGIKLDKTCYNDLAQLSACQALVLDELKIKQNNAEPGENTVQYQQYVTRFRDLTPVFKSFLRNQTKLQTLVLNGFVLSNDDFKDIYYTLSKLKTLELTGIRQLGAFNEHAPQENPLPKFNNHHKELIIRSDIIRYPDMSTALLGKEHTTLQTLHFVGKHNPEWGYSFFENLGQLKNLRELSLGSTLYNLHDREMSLILNNIANPEKLERLVITQAMITDCGLKGISKFRNLKLLNIQDHCRVRDITDASVDELENLTKMEYLSLDMTKISDKGLLELSRKMPLITEMDVTDCINITQQGKEAAMENWTYFKGYYEHDYSRNDDDITYSYIK